MVDNIEFAGRIKGPKDIGSAVLTGSWAAVGSSFKSSGIDALDVWTKLTINDSQTVQVRAVGKLSDNGSAYPLPVRGDLGTAVAQPIEDDYFQFGSDADQYRGIRFDVGGAVPYTEVQVKAGTVGGTAGIVEMQLTAR